MRAAARAAPGIPQPLRTPAACASLRSGSGPSPAPRDCCPGPTQDATYGHIAAPGFPSNRGDFLTLMAWRCGHASWYHWLVATGPVSFEVVPIDKPADMNVIIGQAHFIKTVEDLHEALAGVSPHLRFGLAFCEASSARLVRRSGNDDELTGRAAANALAIGAGHSFVILLREGFPINVLNPLKAVPEVCTIFCATANPVDVLVAVTNRGRGIIGVIDGSPPTGIEQDTDVTDRRSLLRAIGYKL